MEHMTMDVIIAIIQSNLAAHMGEQIDPGTMRILCAEIRDSIEHHDNNKEKNNG